MTTCIRGTRFLLLLFGVVLATPGYAVAEPDAKLYELTENMSLSVVKGKQQRVATSELMGFAMAGTPLCPQELVDQVSPGATFCTVNATGSNKISLFTGMGPFGGTFTVVVQGDNAVDSPEFVVAKGKFRGKMDFSPAVLHTIPLGSVTGKLWLNGRGDNDDDDGGVPFTGIFRLPFVVSLGPDEDPRACLDGPHPETCLSPALYLKDDGSTVAVRQDEKALGYPTVRLEITF